MAVTKLDSDALEVRCDECGSVLPGVTTSEQRMRTMIEQRGWGLPDATDDPVDVASLEPGADLGLGRVQCPMHLT